jgi:antirestriction protein ArdC
LLRRYILFFWEASNNFKSITSQVAEKLIQQFKEGNSVFQQNDGKPMLTPFNARSGKNYRGAPALVLMMKQEADPRWMTLEQGNYMKNNVMKDEKGTLISFYKTSEMRKAIEDGKPGVKENGKPKMESVKLEEPVLVTAFVYNAKQLKDMADLEKVMAERQKVAPEVRIKEIMANSGLGPDATLRSIAESIIAEKPNESSIKDALKANIAALFLAAELQQPFELDDHIGYIEPWSILLKEEPADLFKAANDAQYVADKVLALEKKREVELKAATTLNKGDEIAYKADTYKVLQVLKGKVAQLENSDGHKFKVGPKDGLYAALLNAKSNPAQKEAIVHEMKPKEETNYAVAR